MVTAELSDRPQVVKIIQESFHDNPSVVSVINPKKPNALKALARYSFDTAFSRGGVFLSKDKESVAICYRYNHNKETLRDYWNQLLLVIKCIGFRRVVNVMKRESYVKKIRPHSDFLYFWFFGSTSSGIKSGASKELKNGIFELSRETDLPIYLETSVEKNRRVYEYFSFETYHSWDLSDNKTLYFMRREPTTEN